MKKILFLLITALFVLTGCAESNPGEEAVIEVFKGSELGAYIEKTEVYTESTDPEELLGAEHQYTEKVGLFDNRYKTDSSDPSVVIEVFENKQDAQIRYDYYSMINECRKAFTESKDLKIDGMAVLKEAAVYQNGNIVMKALDTMGHNVAEAYFKVMETYLSDTNYSQKGLVSDEEYETLHKEAVDDRKNEAEAAVEKAASDILNQADRAVKDQLDKFKDALDDSALTETEKLISSTYSSGFFDQKRREWEESFNELKDLKAEKETEYQAEADRIDALITDALENPDQEKYDTISEAVNAVPDNYYFEKIIPSWNKKLSELKDTLIIMERDRNAAELNRKLDEAEKTLDPDLFDEIKESVKSYTYNNLYNDFIDDWNSRIRAIEDAVAKERRKKEIADFKASCKKIGYKEFSRNSEDYVGTPVYFKGEVIQVVDQDEDGAELRVNVTATGTYYTYYTDTVYVEYDNSDEISTTKILEDDIIEIWGYGAGDVSYTSVLGSKITIPAVLAKYIKVK